MKQITLDDLAADVSLFVKRAKEGEHFAIMEDGHCVARITPPRSTMTWADFTNDEGDHSVTEELAEVLEDSTDGVWFTD